MKTLLYVIDFCVYLHLPSQKILIVVVVVAIADREVQRILLELLNQMDGFDQNVNVKVCYWILLQKIFLSILWYHCYVKHLCNFEKAGFLSRPANTWTRETKWCVGAAKFAFFFISFLCQQKTLLLCDWMGVFQLYYFICFWWLHRKLDNMRLKY